MGDLDGVFSAEQDEIKDIIGKRIYFGEVLGKHSEVFEVMEEEYFTEVTTNQEFIKLFDELGLSTGYSPFDYDLEETDNDSDKEEDEEELEMYDVEIPKDSYYVKF